MRFFKIDFTQFTFQMHLKTSEVLKKSIVFLLIAGNTFNIKAQTKADSTKTKSQTLNEVTIKAYFSKKPLLSIPSSISVIDSQQISQTSGTSLISAVNTAPGVRMEERSPGSYRLSIRGSLLRSPFGIRNVKIYLDDFPLTDAGGNTYLNLLNANSVHSLEILKGPEASIYGSNSGGVVIINTTNPDKLSTKATAAIQGGSFGLFNQKFGLQKKASKYQFTFNQSSQKSNGYRENSALERNAFQTSHQYNYSAKGNLKAVVLFSDLNYNTPGGITEAQVATNPKLSRQRAGNTPGAIEQKAGVHNRTIFGGVSNEFNFSPTVKHVIATYGSSTNFSNPFITNYERRTEKTLGLRTYIELTIPSAKTADIKWQTGLEGGTTSSDILNYANLGGVAGKLQAADQLAANQYFVFTHATTNFKKLTLEGAVSLNYFNFNYGSLVQPVKPLSKRTFKAQIMPRFAASYPVFNSLWVRGSASRGYSPPTIAEVRASDNNINANLQAESGWNYETGLRYKANNGLIYADAVVFTFQQRNAIVRRVNEADQEYFLNAGGTKQTGLEFQFSAWILSPSNTRFINGIQLTNSFTYSNFKFTNYQKAADNYSGNHLTGVPKNTSVSSILINLPSLLYIYTTHNFTDAIPLNDANTVTASSYHLFQAKVGKQLWFNHTMCELNAGADNLFNKKYSLGNDLNALGGRFYNPAPLRNYYLGLSFTFK